MIDHYAESPHPQLRPAGLLADWLVDGYNVLNVALLGGQPRAGVRWWKAESRETLLARIRGFDARAFLPDDLANDCGAEGRGKGRPRAGEGIWVVFDGDQPAPGESRDESGVAVIFSPSADDWITKRVRGAERPGEIAVVSADRQLTDRCRHRGAWIVHPRDFIAHCHADPEGEEGGPR
jgi:predicted RNA-binding protein with PIN domain